MTWDESMATGVPEIDAQHKELLERFDALSDALAQGKGREETGETLDFLQFYAQWHFGREEKCMEQYQCPVAARNQEGHREFMRRFGQLYELYQMSDVNPQVIHQTFIELRDWIIGHIKAVDTQLNPCVAHHPQAAHWR